MDEFSILLLSFATLILIIVVLLVYTSFTEGSELDRFRQILKGTIKKVGLHQGCSHHFGYLFAIPKNRPLPNECMGCSEVFECLENKKSKPRPPEKALGVESSQSQVTRARTAKVRKPKTTSGKTKKKIVSTEAETKPKRSLQKKKTTGTRKKER